MSVFTVGCDPYASRWWVGDGMLTRRERLSAAGRLREWWTVRRVWRAHEACERWVEPPMSCIMDACSKTRVVGRDDSLLYELPLSE